MQVFLCDDEPGIVSVLTEQVHKILPESKVEGFTDGISLLRALQKKDCDILLLDIDMPEMNGLDVAKCLEGCHAKPFLIFVTSHDELVYDSFHYHPFGFIRKSRLEEELEKVLKDCCLEMTNREKHFYFHTASADVRLDLQDILYFEADGNYLKVFTKETCYRFRETLLAVENALSMDGFVRVHKGFLINQAAVRIIGQGDVELINGSHIPFGRMYLESAKKRLKEYIVKAKFGNEKV